MASQRRIGTEGSETRAALLVAAEQLMRAEGYSAVTSRGLARFAGLKPQLVHYYFRTMDELFEALFRKGAEEYLAALKAISKGDDALLAMWRISCSADVAVMTVEFLALANRRAGIRKLMSHYSHEYAQIQLGIVGKALDDAGLDKAQWPPAAIVAIMENFPKLVAILDEFEIDGGGGEARAFITRLLEKVAAAKL
jgi:TetR/AcrR family transcriptional regulator